jgi:hypothetical protein
LLALATVSQALAQTGAPDARFQRFDKNGDGKITAEEISVPGAFEAADTNGDGFVTPDEFAAYLAKRQAMRAGKAAGPRQRPLQVELPEDVAVERGLR